MRKHTWIAVVGVAALLSVADARAAESDSKAMANQIASQIHSSGQLSNYRVGVKYKDGVAWLLGSVTDPAQARIAMNLAKQVDGVDRVISKLQVGQPEQAPAATETATKAATPAIESTGGLLLQLEDDGSNAAAANQQKVAYQPQTLTPPAAQQALQSQQAGRRGMPMPFARTAAGQQMAGNQRGQGQVRPANYGAMQAQCYGGAGGPAQGYTPAAGMGGASGVNYENPNMPGYAWPSYASHPNYAAVTYPKQYSPTAWPYIGPFYPYPQVPLGWRKVALEWDDGWWHLDFSHHQRH